MFPYVGFSSVCLLFVFYIFLKCFHLFLRESCRVGGGKGQRERETQNLKQAPGSEMLAQSLTRTRRL